MKALVYKDVNTLKVEEVPTPKAGPGELVIKTDLSGICGSDVNMVRHGIAQPGSVLGHEAVGNVIEIGAGVEGWTEGASVLIKANRFCGDCEFCKDGKTNVCDYKAGDIGGGFAEYILATPDMLTLIPDKLTPERAVLWNPAANGIHAWKLTRSREGASVFIMGAGPIGLFVIRAAKRAGASTVIASDPLKTRRDLAERFGADVTIDPTACDVLSELKTHTGDGPDIVLECVGGQDTLQEAAIFVRRRGQVILYGLFMQPVTVIPMLWILKEIDIQAGIGYVDSDITDTFELFTNDDIPAEEMVTSTIPIEDAPAMFQALQRTEKEIKAIISFRD